MGVTELLADLRHILDVGPPAELFHVDAGVVGASLDGAAHGDHCHFFPSPLVPGVLFVQRAPRGEVTERVIPWNHLTLRSWSQRVVAQGLRYSRRMSHGRGVRRPVGP